MAERHEPGARREGRIDAFKLAARRGVVERDVDPYALSRLADRLADEEESDPVPATGLLHYRVEGVADSAGRPALDIAVVGEVPLTCQRCLQPFALAVDQRIRVLLARDDNELAFLDENDEHEVVLAAEPVDPLELVEDELLLCLPFVPRCVRPDCLANEGRAQEQGSAAPERSSPFASLASLKDGGKGPGGRRK